ncbi:hypothetical protein Q1695_009586 [Nippostrongylus brasiliensis]|nr:hypothetical protein Q1695_009586 [Nippostrongylus brasiliensis]
MDGYSAIPDEEYIRSLNIPQIEFNIDSVDHLQIHMLCAMLCSPKQLSGEGAVEAELVLRNASEISNYLLDFYTIARVISKGDENEIYKMKANLNQVLLHKSFSRVVTNGGDGRIYANPPDSVKDLYNRILRAGNRLRAKEEQHENKKRHESNTPEYVYNAIVACNFLLELIEAVCRQEGRTMVEWQLVQKRYEDMVHNEESEDRELMKRYQNKYNMAFPDTPLNSDVIKRWTGRNGPMKGFGMPIFKEKIAFEVQKDTGVIHVGFDDNTCLYSDEEINKARARLEGGEQPKKYERYEKKKPVERVRGNELENVVPLLERRVIRSVPNTVDSSSQFAQKVESREYQPNQSYSGRQSQPAYASSNQTSQPQPQYIPSSAILPETESDSDTDSNDEPKDNGVYTDEEDNANETKPQEPPQSKFGATGEWASNNKSAPTETVKEPSSMPASRPSYSRPNNYVPPQALNPETHLDAPQSANPWENSSNDAKVVKPSPQYEQPSNRVPEAPKVTRTSANVPGQQPAPSSDYRHRSAFAALKSAPVVEQLSRTKIFMIENWEGTLFSTIILRFPCAVDRPNVPEMIVDPPIGVRVKLTGRILATLNQREEAVRRMSNTATLRAIKTGDMILEIREEEAVRRMSNTATLRAIKTGDMILEIREVYFYYRVLRIKRLSYPGNGVRSSCIVRESRQRGNPGYSMSASDQYRDAGAGYDEPSRIGRLSSRGTYTPVPPKGAEDSVFSRPIGDDYYRDNSSRQSVRDRPPSSSYNRGQSDQYEHRDGHRRRDYDSRDEMSSSRGSSNSYRSTGSAGNNRDLRDEREFVGSREDVATPVIDVADNRSLSLSNRTSLPGDSNLSEEVRTCLRIIRDFAFVHRNATSCGFKTIESIISHLPGGHNADYWIQLINQHLSEVEVVLFRKSQVIVWKEDQK